VSVESYFHARAEQFDSLYGPQPRWQRWLNRHFRAGLYERVALALAEMQALTDFSVLDVGCGSGRNTLLFAEAGAREVVGIDFAPNMIALARKISAQHPLAARLKFAEADFSDYEFGRSFDACVALGVFDYLKDPLPVLHKMAALSRRLVIGSFPGISLVRAPLRKARYALRGCPVYFYSHRRLREIFHAAGLPQHRIVPCSSGFVVVGESQSQTSEVAAGVAKSGQVV
jgi:SAM-dependent methyltransferase